jgi:hypothetical protein
MLKPIHKTSYCDVSKARTSRTGTSEIRKEWWYSDRLFGTNSLKKGAMWRISMVTHIQPWWSPRPYSNITSTHPLVREGAPHEESRNRQTENKNLVMGSRWELDIKTNWPTDRRSQHNLNSRRQLLERASDKTAGNKGRQFKMELVHCESGVAVAEARRPCEIGESVTVICN